MAGSSHLVEIYTWLDSIAGRPYTNHREILLISSKQGSYRQNLRTMYRDDHRYITNRRQGLCIAITQSAQPPVEIKWVPLVCVDEVSRLNPYSFEYQKPQLPQ